MTDSKICPIMSSGKELVECIEERCAWSIEERILNRSASSTFNCAFNALVLRSEDLRATLAQELILMTSAVKQTSRAAVPPAP